MTRARQWWLRAIAPAAGSLLGCAVVSTHAIRGELPVTLDPALAGAWRAIDDDGEGSDADRFTFESHGDHYVLAIAGEDEVYEVTTARLGGERYANAVEIGDESGAVALFRYRVDGDRLRIAALDRDAVARYAARGELAVEGDDAKPASPLVIKSGRAALEAFLLEHDPRELFPEPKGYALRITER